MIDEEDKTLSIRRQCDLIELGRSNYYYQPKGWSSQELEVMRVIDEVYTEHPYYGTRRMSKVLEARGYCQQGWKTAYKRRSQIINLILI